MQLNFVDSKPIKLWPTPRKIGLHADEFFYVKVSVYPSVEPLYGWITLYLFDCDDYCIAVICEGDSVKRNTKRELRCTKNGPRTSPARSNCESRGMSRKMLACNTSRQKDVLFLQTEIFTLG